MFLVVVVMEDARSRVWIWCCRRSRRLLWVNRVGLLMLLLCSVGLHVKLHEDANDTRSNIVVDDCLIILADNVDTEFLLTRDASV